MFYNLSLLQPKEWDSATNLHKTIIDSLVKEIDTTSIHDFENGIYSQSAVSTKIFDYESFLNGLMPSSDSNFLTSASSNPALANTFVSTSCNSLPCDTTDFVFSEIFNSFTSNLSYASSNFSSSTDSLKSSSCMSKFYASSPIQSLDVTSAANQGLNTCSNSTKVQVNCVNRIDNSTSFLSKPSLPGMTVDDSKVFYKSSFIKPSIEHNSFISENEPESFKFACSCCNEQSDLNKEASCYDNSLNSVKSLSKKKLDTFVLSEDVTAKFEGTSNMCDDSNSIYSISSRHVPYSSNKSVYLSDTIKKCPNSTSFEALHSNSAFSFANDFSNIGLKSSSMSTGPLPHTNFGNFYSFKSVSEICFLLYDTTHCIVRHLLLQKPLNKLIAKMQELLFFLKQIELRIDSNSIDNDTKFENHRVDLNSVIAKPKKGSSFSLLTIVLVSYISILGNNDDESSSLDMSKKIFSNCNNERRGSLCATSICLSDGNNEGCCSASSAKEICSNSTKEGSVSLAELTISPNVAAESFSNSSATDACLNQNEEHSSFDSILRVSPDEGVSFSANNKTLSSTVLSDCSDTINNSSCNFLTSNAFFNYGTDCFSSSSASGIYLNLINGQSQFSATSNASFAEVSENSLSSSSIGSSSNLAHFSVEQPTQFISTEGGSKISHEEVDSIVSPKNLLNSGSKKVNKSDEYFPYSLTSNFEKCSKPLLCSSFSENNEFKELSPLSFSSDGAEKAIKDFVLSENEALLSCEIEGNNLKRKFNEVQGRSISLHESDKEEGELSKDENMLEQDEKNCVFHLTSKENKGENMENPKKKDKSKSRKNKNSKKKKISGTSKKDFKIVSDKKNLKNSYSNLEEVILGKNNNLSTQCKQVNNSNKHNNTQLSALKNSSLDEIMNFRPMSSNYFMANNALQQNSIKNKGRNRRSALCMQKRREKWHQIKARYCNKEEDKKQVNFLENMAHCSSTNNNFNNKQNNNDVGENYNNNNNARCKEKSTAINKTPKLCRFFMQSGICRNGEKCTFSHCCIPETKNNSLCQFFEFGKCKKGDKCTFSHDLSKFLCRFAVCMNGYCPKEKTCMYCHDFDLNSMPYSAKLDFVHNNKTFLKNILSKQIKKNQIIESNDRVNELGVDDTNYLHSNKSYDSIDLESASSHKLSLPWYLQMYYDECFLKKTKELTTKNTQLSQSINEKATNNDERNEENENLGDTGGEDSKEEETCINNANYDDDVIKNSMVTSLTDLKTNLYKLSSFEEDLCFSIPVELTTKLVL